MAANQRFCIAFLMDVVFTGTLIYTQISIPIFIKINARFLMSDGHQNILKIIS